MTTQFLSFLWQKKRLQLCERVIIQRNRMCLEKEGPGCHPPPASLAYSQRCNISTPAFVMKKDKERAARRHFWWCSFPIVQWWKWCDFNALYFCSKEKDGWSSKTMLSGRLDLQTIKLVTVKLFIFQQNNRNPIKQNLTRLFL